MSVKTEPTEEVLDDAVVEALSQAVKTVAPGPRQKVDMRARILARINGPPPAGSFTLRAHEGEWIRLSPLVEKKVLHRNRQHNTQTTLWRLQPGGIIPAHRHSAEEECLVLEGEVRLGGHYASAGDFHVIQSGYDHGDTITETGALLLIHSNIADYKAPRPGTGPSA
jgi:quercetin dioxygenase-like cupin family protein